MGTVIAWSLPPTLWQVTIWIRARRSGAARCSAGRRASGCWDWGRRLVRVRGRHEAVAAPGHRRDVANAASLVLRSPRRVRATTGRRRLPRLRAAHRRPPARAREGGPCADPGARPAARDQRHSQPVCRAGRRPDGRPAAPRRHGARERELGLAPWRSVATSQLVVAGIVVPARSCRLSHTAPALGVRR
jgi:hypothetical protein